MTEERTVIPSDYPQLGALVIGTGPTEPIAAKGVFALYERNWHMIDQTKLTDAEKQLIRDLTDEFGGGEILLV